VGHVRPEQHHLAIALLGSVVLVGFQYKVGKWAALRSVGAEDMDEQRYAQIHQFVEGVSVTWAWRSRG